MYRGKINVPNQLAIERVHSSIQHNRAWLDHISGETVMASDAGKEQISLSGNISKIRCSGVAECHGGVLPKEKQRSRFASGCASSYDYRVLPLDWNAGMAQQL
jgi:hypothetical protein